MIEPEKSTEYAPSKAACAADAPSQGNTESSGTSLSVIYRKLAPITGCAAILLAGMNPACLWPVPPKPSAAPFPVSSRISAPLPSPRVRSTARAAVISHFAHLKTPPKSSAPRISAAGVAPPAVLPVSRAQAVKIVAALPMSFEANAGQTDARVKFLAHASGYTLFLTNQEAVLALQQAAPEQPSHLSAAVRGLDAKTLQKAGPARAVRIRFVGGNKAAAIAGRDQLPGKTNYLIGNDPRQWHTNVPNYSAVNYHGIYPGVDAVFHGDNRRLEFDIDLAPGADPHTIALEVDGAARVRLTQEGDVLLGLDRIREVVMGKPHIYQQSSNGHREITGHYVLSARNRITFALGNYDHLRPLVIDPTLAYSTYLGGSEEDFPYAIAADSSGSAYIAGQAYSANFPVTAGSYQTSCAGTGKTTCTAPTAYVAKLSPDGSSLVYSTFFNGQSGGDEATGIALDSSGSAYIVGAEQGETDFPTTTGAIQPVCNGGGNTQTEIFVAKLGPTGSTLDYSTCLLDSIPSASNQYSSGSSSPGGIAVDSDGNAYVTGETDLPQSFPTTQGSFQTTCQQNGNEGCNVEEDPFVVKINSTGTSLVYSTFLSGGAFGAETYTLGIAVDSLGNAYVIGNDINYGPFPAGSPGGLLTTRGTLVPTCTNLGCGGFLSKINGDGTVLVYSTYLANVSLSATPTAVVVNQNGEAYVSGYTSATDFPATEGALQYYFTPPGVTTANETDGFVVEMGYLGASYEYATFLGGAAGNTEATGIGIDAAGHAFVTGITNAGYPTTPDAFQTTDTAGASQAFFSELDPDGATLLYSTYLAGTTGEAFDTEPSSTGVSYLAMDPNGNAYITGQTDSPNFPTTPAAYQAKSPLAGGGQDQTVTGFVAKFSFAAVATLTISPATVPSGTAKTAYSPVTFTATGGTGTVTFAVTSGTLPAGMTLTSAGLLSGTPTKAGSFPITVTATDANNGTGSQAYTLVIACQAITVGPTSLAAGTYGAAYPTVTFTETGGIGPTTFTETGTLPTGMVFEAPELGGKPTQTGSFPIKVTATDSNSCAGSASDTLTILSSGVLTLSPAALPPATAGTVYSQTLTASGSSGTVTFAVTSGSLPAGITLTSAGVLSGKSTKTGTFGITITATDTSKDTGSKYFLLQVVCQQISVEPTSLKSGTVGTAYPAVRFTQTGGIGTTTITETGELPAGMKFVSPVLSGTPVEAGSFPIYISAKDSNSCIGTIREGLTILPVSALTISPTTIPTGTAGVKYKSITFTASGGSGTAVITESGALPPGMTFSKGVLSGTPEATGSYAITITATDANRVSGNEKLTLKINCPTIDVAPDKLPNGYSGSAYGPVAFRETGGVGAITFTESGTLPPGMKFAKGVLSGTPTKMDTVALSVSAVDSNQCSGKVMDKLAILGPHITDAETITVTDALAFPDSSDSEPITITDSGIVRAFDAIAISPTPAMFNATHGKGAEGVTYGPIKFTATGGTGALTLNVSGPLPAGITFKNGSLGGRPSSKSAATYVFDIVATDADSDRATVTGYKLTITK